MRKTVSVGLGICAFEMTLLSLVQRLLRPNTCFLVTDTDAGPNLAKGGWPTARFTSHSSLPLPRIPKLNTFCVNVFRQDPATHTLDL